MVSSSGFFLCSGWDTVFESQSEVERTVTEATDVLAVKKQTATGAAVVVESTVDEDRSAAVIVESVHSDDVDCREGVASVPRITAKDDTDDSIIASDDKAGAVEEKLEEILDPNEIFNYIENHQWGKVLFLIQMHPEVISKTMNEEELTHVVIASIESADVAREAAEAEAAKNAKKEEGETEEEGDALPTVTSRDELRDAQDVVADEFSTEDGDDQGGVQKKDTEATYDISSILETPSSKNRKGNSVIHEVCKHGAPLEVVSLILQLNIDAAFIECPQFGYLPIHYAATADSDGAAASSKLSMSSSLDVIAKLLDVHPEGIHHKGKGGMLPLHVACKSHAKTSVLLALMAAYPRALEVKDRAGMLPQDYCVSNGKGDVNEDAFNLCKYVLAATKVTRIHCEKQAQELLRNVGETHNAQVKTLTAKNDQAEIKLADLARAIELKTNEFDMTKVALQEREKVIIDKELECVKLKDEIAEKEQQVEMYKTNLTAQEQVHATMLKDEEEKLKLTMDELDELKKKLEDAESEIKQTTHRLKEKEQDMLVTQRALGYKERLLEEKEDAVNQLTNTISERDATIDSIKSQLQDRVKEIDDKIELLKRKEQAIRESNLANKKLQGTISEKDMTITTLETKLTKTCKELVEVEKMLIGNQKALNDKVVECTDLRLQLAAKEKTIDTLRSQVQEKEQEIVERDEQLDEKQKTIEEKQSTCLTLQDTICTKQGELSAVEAKLMEKEQDILKNEKILGDVQKLIKEKRSACFTLQETVNSTQEKLQILESKLRERDQEIVKLTQHLQARDRTIKEQEAKCVELQESLTSSKTSKNDMEEEVSTEVVAGEDAIDAPEDESECDSQGSQG